ncbi:hypothetical protein ACF0H5_007533 [Mactra antiquata]
MAVEMKKIWIAVKRTDLGEDDTSSLHCIDILENQSGQQIKHSILKSCNLCHNDPIVVKLRNHRGSLMPITWNIPANNLSKPYILEVVQVHQNVKARPRSVKIKNFNEATKEKISDIIKRIEKLEGAAPELKDKRNDRINKEMKEVEQMLEFLAKRMQDAETVKWKGMFKKNPLW